MIKAVIFDMYETLITHYGCPLYFGRQMAADAGISEEKFQALWRLFLSYWDLPHRDTYKSRTSYDLRYYRVKDKGVS